MPQIFCCHSLWWTRQQHLRMLSPAFTTMPKETWKNCPTFHKCCGTKKNADAKGKHPVSLNIAMITLYKQGKSISTSNAKKRTQSQFSDSDDDFTDTPSHHSQGTISYVDHSIKMKFFMKTLVSCSGSRGRSHTTIHLNANVLLTFPMTIMIWSSL